MDRPMNARNRTRRRSTEGAQNSARRLFRSRMSVGARFQPRETEARLGPLRAVPSARDRCALSGRLQGLARVQRRPQGCRGPGRRAVRRRHVAAAQPGSLRRVLPGLWTGVDRLAGWPGFRTRVPVREAEGDELKCTRRALTQAPRNEAPLPDRDTPLSNTPPWRGAGASWKVWKVERTIPI